MRHRELPAKEFDNSRSTLSAPTGGYACAFNSQGDLESFMQATGEPGWHYIDHLPGDLQGQRNTSEQLSLIRESCDNRAAREYFRIGCEHD